MFIKRARRRQTVLLLKLLDRLLGIRAHFAIEGAFIQTRGLQLLLRRAEIADEYGDTASAKAWREIAAIAARVARAP